MRKIRMRLVDYIMNKVIINKSLMIDLICLAFLLSHTFLPLSSNSPLYFSIFLSFSPNVSHPALFLLITMLMIISFRYRLSQHFSLFASHNFRTTIIIARHQFPTDEFRCGLLFTTNIHSDNIICNKKCSFRFPKVFPRLLFSYFYVIAVIKWVQTQVL
jgi:hypothetical protein